MGYTATWTEIASAHRSAGWGWLSGWSRMKGENVPGRRIWPPSFAKNPRHAEAAWELTADRLTPDRLPGSPEHGSQGIHWCVPRERREAVHIHTRLGGEGSVVPGQTPSHIHWGDPSPSWEGSHCSEDSQGGQTPVRECFLTWVWEGTVPGHVNFDTCS